MSYLKRTHLLSACRNLQSFYSELSSLYISYGMNIESNRGRRNILMSEPMEKFLADELRKTLDVENDGRTGKADIVVHLASGSLELECKLTSPHASSGSICFQTDYETLEKKKSLDYIYIVANEDFSGFCAVHFVGLTLDDFRGLSPGARGKVQMFKHRGMNKANVLMGEVIDLKMKRIDRLENIIKDITEQNKTTIFNLIKEKDLLRDAQIYDRNEIDHKIERSQEILNSRVNKMKKDIKLSLSKNSRYTFKFEKLEK